MIKKCYILVYNQTHKYLVDIKPTAPKLNICIKHKQNKQIRPVIRNTQTPPYKLAKYLNKKLQNLICLPYTYLLIPWCRVLEQLTGLQLVKKFPAFHGTRRFITALTSVRNLSLSWASPIQSI